MKALILAGGRGNRLNEFSENQNKCMIAFRGKPLIEHILENTSALDFSEIVIVVGYKAEDIINHYGISFKKKRIRYVIQPEQKGLVHAIECARKALDGEDFFLMLGDEVMSTFPSADDAMNAGSQMQQQITNDLTQKQQKISRHAFILKTLTVLLKSLLN